MLRLLPFSFFFFFNDTATTEIYTLSLHDALPISLNPHYIEALVHRAIVLNELGREAEADAAFRRAAQVGGEPREGDRKSTRLNSSHGYISYAVFCLKKKKTDELRMTNKYQERVDI